MKTFIYILGGIFVLIGGSFLYSFFFVDEIPPLAFPEGSTDEQKIEIVDSWFENLQKDHKFNGVVLIAEDGKAQLSQGYGYANPETKEKLNKFSMLRLASVSKQFTASGIMLLNKKGQLQYDDPVEKHIKGFPYTTVTIRHLLNMTSGFPDSYMDLAEENMENIPLLTNELATSLVINANKPAYAKPGAQFAYSNTNYIFLARIIEVLSGLSFEDYMKKEVFDPLGMEYTRVWNLLSEDQKFPHKADDLNQVNNSMEVLAPTFLDGVAGDGAVFCSVHDFVIWDQFWYGNELLNEDDLQEAFKTPALANGDTSNYGFGWNIVPNGMVHNGGWLGARTIIMRNTEKRTCWVILDNSSNNRMGKISQALVKAYREN